MSTALTVNNHLTPVRNVRPGDIVSPGPLFSLFVTEVTNQGERIVLTGRLLRLTNAHLINVAYASNANVVVTPKEESY